MTRPKTSNRREHALHNEAACEYLNASGEFPDWVITTAFYSALHFVEHKLFPLKEGDFNFRSYNIYCDHMHRLGEIGFSNLHKGRKTLVRRKLPNINAAYKELFDSCHNARYVGYEVDERDVTLALGYLAEIKKMCNTGKPIELSLD